MSDFLRSIATAAQGLRAQSGRMRIISENIANAGTTPSKPGEAPYRRKIPVFETRADSETGGIGVSLTRIRRDRSDFGQRLEPGHPAADAAGMVKTPNVDFLIEQMDMREAQRSYEANVSVITAARRMIARTLDILKV